MPYRYMLYRYILTSLILLLVTVYSHAGTLKIAYTSDNIVDFDLFVNHRKIESIQNYTGPYSRRDVIDAVLYLQALKLGGIHDPVQFIPVDTYQRILSSIVKGRVVSGAQTNWGYDVLLNQNFYNTQPLVREGEFVVGIYTSPKNTKALSTRNLMQLQQLSAVSNIQWHIDWITMKQLNIRHVYHNTRWANMVKMVSSQHADFTLAPFQATADLHLELDAITLVPIPNIKVALQGSRYWSTSKIHPQGNRVQQALNIGLAKLRAEGRVVRAYRESGFFSDKVADWKIINPSLH